MFDYQPSDISYEYNELANISRMLAFPSAIQKGDMARYDIRCSASPGSPGSPGSPKASPKASRVSGWAHPFVTFAHER